MIKKLREREKLKNRNNRIIIIQNSFPTKKKKGEDSNFIAKV
jgi:hypothetical protein